MEFCHSKVGPLTFGAWQASISVRCQLNRSTAAAFRCNEDSSEQCASRSKQLQRTARDRVPNHIRRRAAAELRR